MNRKIILFLAITASVAASASNMPGKLPKPRAESLFPKDVQLKVTADKVAVDNVSDGMVASGHVHAVAGVYTLRAEKLKRIGNEYHFEDPTSVTTCTNHGGICHWSLTGGVKYTDGKEVVAENMVLRLFEIPVFWVPYWWQPLNTDYGWRVMPGYRTRWGAYLLTKYVYDITDDFRSSDYGLRGATRVDLRAKNGVALGQSVRWKLGDFGTGKFKVYYLNDRDYDYYDKRSNSSYNYFNWGSTLPKDRYTVSLEHFWQISEPEFLRASLVRYSDSYFNRDFMRDAVFGLDNRFPSYQGNEVAWEHLGDTFGLAVSVSGSLNEFYGAVNRLPEFFADVAPQPIFGTPVNYESSTRLGWLNRDYEKIGKPSTYLAFRYKPGLWADYQAFRADTYHRFTLPFKIDDVVSVVPRFGVRGTYWSASGETDLFGTKRTYCRDENVTRAVVEGGITFSARGVGDIDEEWQHVVEPYLDVLAQEASYSGLGKNSRVLYFDSVDGSSDWLDQFAGRSRNLPYSWYGVTPGVRNAFRKIGEDGRKRTVFDFDAYVALQFNDTSWTAGGRYHKLAANQEDPNYGRDDAIMAVPGVRGRVFPRDDISIMARAEWDGQNDSLAYADIALAKKFSENFSASLSYSRRDHRFWDFCSVPFDPKRLKDESFNWVDYSYVLFECEHKITDYLAWGPYVSWDCAENEIDEVGAWFDVKYCCLGFRFCISYENEFYRIDRYKDASDVRLSMGVYLRALGESTAMMFGD